MATVEQQRVAIVTDLISPELHSRYPDLLITDPFVNDNRGSSRLDSSLTPQVVVDELLQGANLSTAAPGSEKIAALYETALLQPGITDVLHVSVGTELSKGYGDAIYIAQQEFFDKAHHFDSQTVFDGTGFMAAHALELARNGKGVEAILSELEAMRKRTLVLAYLDKPEYVGRGGRLGKEIATRFMSIVGVKAVVEMGDNKGTIHGIEMVRSKGLARFVEVVKEVGNGRRIEHITLASSPIGTNAGPREKGLRLDKEKDDIFNALSGRDGETKRYDAAPTPTLTVHLGPQAQGTVVVYLQKA